MIFKEKYHLLLLYNFLTAVHMCFNNMNSLVWLTILLFLENITVEKLNKVRMIRKEITVPKGISFFRYNVNR